MVHHVQEVAAALRVRAEADPHAQVAVVPLVPVVAARLAQVAVVLPVLQALVVQEDLLAPVEPVAVRHVQAAAALRAIAAALAAVVIVAAHAVVPVAVLHSAVLSHRQSMIFSRRKRPSSWKV